MIADHFLEDLEEKILFDMSEEMLHRKEVLDFRITQEGGGIGAGGIMTPSRLKISTRIRLTTPYGDSTTFDLTIPVRAGSYLQIEPDKTPNLHRTYRIVG